MINASGAIFVSIKTERVLLNYRSKETSSPNTWGFFGGKIEKKESILQGLSREIREEIGFLPNYHKVLPLDVYKTSNGEFSYYSFIILVDEEFVPAINHESSGWGWFNIDCLPRPLHSGAKTVLLQKDFMSNFKQIIADVKEEVEG